MRTNFLKTVWFLDSLLNQFQANVGDALNAVASDHDVVSAPTLFLSVAGPIAAGRSAVCYQGAPSAVLQLPLANAQGNAVSAVIFFANAASGAVTLQAVGGNTFSGMGTTLSVAAGALAVLVNDGVSTWMALSSGAGNGAANKYIGQVATRTNVPYNFSSNLAYSMCRSMHYLREDVASVKIAFPGFYVYGGTETAIGAATSVTGSIEYPAGTFTQLRFAGSVTGSIPSGGLLWCDPTAIAIPRGAQFWVRTWTHATTGGAYHTGNTTRQLVSQGDLFQYSPTSISDVTMGGSITSSDSINMGGPCAIVGLTNRPSVAVIGDSRACGEYDVFSDNSGDLGEIARSIGPSYAYAYLSAGGDTAASWASANANRAALAAYFSHSMIEYGINDVNAGSSNAAIQGFINTIVASLPASQTKFITTIAPYATSTDNWATLVNQSAGAHESTRSANNIWRRTVPSGFANCFDVSAIVESSASPGKWNVDGTAFKWTADGIHESPFAYQAIQASRVISTSLTIP